MEKHGVKYIDILKQQTFWNIKEQAKTTNIQKGWSTLNLFITSV